MKKRGMGLFIALGGIALVLIIASIFLIVSSSYNAKLVLVNDGFFVGDQVHDCLYAADESAVVTSIPAINASQSDILYEKSGKFYVGDDYTPISLNYPYVINNGSAVMFTSSVDKLITGTFEYVDSYENLYMSGGVTYNTDMERAYREDFILVDAGNGLYMNADALTVGGSLTTAGEIPVHSFIRFMEDEIDYYYYSGDALLYDRIAPVSKVATISLGGFNYTYIEFLEKLGLYTERKVKEKVTPTPTKAPEEGEPDDTQAERTVIRVNDTTPEEGDTSGEGTKGDAIRTSTQTGGEAEGEAVKTDPQEGEGRDDDEDREQITPDPGERPTREPRPTKVPSLPEPADEPLPAEDQGTRVTPTPRPTATPLPTPTLMPFLEQTATGGDPMVPEAPAAAAPAAPAAAAPAAVVVPKEYHGTPQRPVYYEEWKKPEVHLGDVTTGTFTIFLDNFNIENAQFLYKRYGVQFYVKEGTDNSGKLVYTKNVLGSGALRLAQPFKPETKYTLKVVLNYINPYGETVVEEVVDYGKIIVETKSRDFLDKLDLGYTKGKKASNSFKLKDVGIGIAKNNPSGRFIESVEYLSRLEFEVVNALDSRDTRVVSLGSTELNKLRKGQLFDYESSRVFSPNSTYNYTVRAYDRGGELLRFENGTAAGAAFLTGTFKTCTESPRATFRVQSNKIYDYTVAIRINNSGNAEMRSPKFRVLDVDNNVVETTVEYITTASGGAVSFSAPEKLGIHEFPAELIDGIYDSSAGIGGVDPNRIREVVVKFKDLSDQSVYILEVFSDYDIYDYDEADYPNGVPEEEKWHLAEVIGTTKFTTANISSLGNLFLDNEIPATEENLAEGRLYMTLKLGDRTNDLLLDLIDDITIGFYKNEKDDKGQETGNYVLDENAQISYIVCDATNDTEYTDIASVLTGVRPAEYDDWVRQANEAKQLAYDRALVDYYDEKFLEVRGEYRTVRYDEEGNETELTFDDLLREAQDAQDALNSGAYAGDSEEFAALSAIVDNYAEVRDQLESLALNRTREKAEEVAQEAYDTKFALVSNNYTGKAPDEGSFKIGSLYGGDTEGLIDELKIPYTPSATASGTAISLKYQKELRIVVTGLATNSQYEIRAKAGATVGTSGKKSEVRTVLARSSFRTYRKRAVVKMDAYYASSSFISLFGVSIDDPDGAINEYPVELTVTNRTGGVMGVRKFNSATDTFDEIRFNSLAQEEEYTFLFLAKGYNKAWSKASEEINKEIYVNDLDETLKIITHESIKADISLIGINDAYDLAPEIRALPLTTGDTRISSAKYSTSYTGAITTNVGRGSWSFDGTVYYYYGNGNNYKRALYTVNVDFGDEYYNIIEPGIQPVKNRYTRYEVYTDSTMTTLVSDPDDPAAEVRVTGNTASSSPNGFGRCYWTSNYIRLNQSFTGKQTFYVLATATNFDNPLGGASSSNSGIYPLTGFAFHKFGDKAYTANINAILKDDFGQLGSGGVSTYYVRVYEKEGEAVSGNSGYHLISERVHEWRELKDTEEDNNLKEHDTDNCLLSMYEYDKYAEGGRGTPLGQKSFVGGSKQIDTNFGVRVNRGKYYRLELWVKINNYSIRVGTVNFTSDRIIHSITCLEDLYDAYCNPSESYIVTTDLTLSRANIFNTKTFNGVIDFNGHTVTHLTNDYLIYNLGPYGEIRNLVFEKGNGGLNNYKNIRGVVYDNYGHLDNIIVRYKNEIEPVRVWDETTGQWRWTGRDWHSTDAAQGWKNFRESQYVQGLLCTNAYPTAVVENFSIDVQYDIHFYAGDGVGLAVYNNYGMVRNGYSCSTTGAKIHQVSTQVELEKLYDNATNAKNQFTGSYYTGGLVRRNVNGIIEGVVGMVDMEIRKCDTIYKKGASICGLNEGLVRNSFSTAVVLNYNPNDEVYEVKVGRSPANLNFVEGNNVYGHSANVYHYTQGYDYEICKDGTNITYDSVEIRKELLYDQKWYSALFDSDDVSKPGQWDYEYLDRGYYPQIAMDECMPAQPAILLPAITTSSSEITPLTAMVTEQNDNDAYVTVTFYNPNGFVLNNITFDYLSSRVVQQWEEGRFYYVRVRVNNPVKYLGVYNIIDFRYSARGSSTPNVKYLESHEYVPVYAEFYKMIYTPDDFATISYGLDENYRIANDIDFMGYDINFYAVAKRDANGKIATNLNSSDNNTGDNNNNCFTGKFDGRGYTLKNIDVGNVGYLFQKVATKIHDLNIENIHTPDLNIYGAEKSNAKYMGLVAIFRSGGSLDNVHVYGARFENITQYCGVLLARNFFENEIVNCSVHDAYLSTGMPAENATAASVGGLVGHNDLGLEIHNCYIDTFEMRADQAGDLYGLGGMVGYTVNGIELENVYAVRGRISTNYSNVGGLIGSIQSMNDVSSSGKNNYFTEEYFIRNYYVDVELVTMADNVGGVIGYTSKLAGWDWGYGVSFGRIVSKSSEVTEKTLGPVVGYYTGNTEDNIKKNSLRLGKHEYVYSGYQVDGNEFTSLDGDETETSRLAHFKNITYTELTDPNTYGWEGALNRPKLAWRDAFEIKDDEIRAGTMPKLYYSYADASGNRTLLPGQKDFSLNKSELEVVSCSTSNDTGTDSATVYLDVVLEHNDRVIVSGVDFEGCGWDGVPEITKEYESDGVTVKGTRIHGLLKLGNNDGAYAHDKFFITAINYQKSPVATMSAIEAQNAGRQLEDKKKEMYIDLKVKSRWIMIGSTTEWNRLMESSLYGRSGYNIYVTEDLDFSQSSINGVQHNVVINSIVGRKGGETTEPYNDDGSYNTNAAVKITGIKLYGDDNDGNSYSFIEQATGKIEGINFKDCSVSQSYAKGVTGKKISNKTALIGIVNGRIENVSFKNITVTGFASANMAPIGLIYNVSRNVTLEDINVIEFKRNKDGYVSTYSNRGGYVAFMGKFAGIDGLTGNRIYIDTSGQNQGGVAGTQVGSTYFWNINVTDVVSFSRLSGSNSAGGPSNFVGGVIGNAKDRGIYQRAGMIHVNNCFVWGHSYVGGIAGRAYIGGWNSDGYRRVTGTQIDGNAVYYDQDYGTSRTDSVRSWVKRGLIVSYAGESVGGGVGLGGAWKMSVEDSVVLGGSYTGGVVGRYAAIDCISKNVYVSRMQEKIEGESLKRSDDPWPSMFFRPGDGYLDLIDSIFSNTGVYYKDTEGTGTATVRKYVGAEGSGITSHEREQQVGKGKYFEWKTAVTNNSGGTDATTFWEEATWGMTSYNPSTDPFATAEKTHGRQGKVREALGTKLQAMGGDYETDGDSIRALTTDRMIRFTYNESIYNPKYNLRYDYIGGVVGYATGFRGGYSENCFVYAPRSIYVGGAAGRISGYDSNYTAFGGTYSVIVKAATVIGGDYVGGIAGETYRYNSAALFIDKDTYVEGRKYATTGRTGSKVGGAIGYVKHNSSVPSEVPQISWVISCATVVGGENVGGIIGGYDQSFYTAESDKGWVFLGNVYTYADSINKANMLFRQMSGTGFPYTAAVWENSEVKRVSSNPVDTKTNKLKDNISPVESISAQNYIDGLSVDPDYKSHVSKVSTDDLKSKTTYVTKLKWPDDAAMTSSNYTTNRFRFANVIGNGYLPGLTMAGSIQSATKVDGVILGYSKGAQNKMYPFEEVQLLIPGVSQGSGASGSSLNHGLIDLSGMPQATLYTSGVDTISIDFSRIDPAYTWTVSIGGQIVSGVVDRKTVSFTYDFVSDVTVVVSGAEGETVVASTGAELAHYVSAASGSYNILTAEGIMRGSGSSTLPTRYGDYVNLYDGKALEQDGSIIDLETGVVTDATSRGTVTLDERTPEPLAKGEYGGYKIETFATYSVTTDLSTGESTVRDGFLFYTDGKSLQSIRTSQKVRPDSVILYSDLENTYFAALGSDRKLQVLLDEAFKVPEGISTEGIYEMSSSRELRAPYCIVRYANGGLCAFNFVTGEILYEQAASRGQAAGGGDATSGSRAVSFSRAMELSDALKSGAVNVDGIVRRSPVSGEEITSTDAIEGPYLDGAGNAPDGTDIGTGERDAVNGTGTEVGEETVDGTPEKSPEDIVGSEDRSAGGGEGEKEELTIGTQPEDNGAGGTEDVGNEPSGKALIPAETGTPDGTEGEVPQTGEAPAGNVGGNTINGTNTINGENGNTDGEVSVAQTGSANSTLGSEATQTSLTSVDPALLASVESEASALIEDGSLSLDTVIEALGTSESEARIKLFGAAAKIADEDGLSVRDAIAAAYKDIVLNPADYIEEPVIEHATFGLTEKEAARARDMEIIKNSLSGKGKIDPSTLSFVPVFNPETGEYELFEIEELLIGEDEAVKSIEERLAESGKFINTANSFRSGSEESKASRDYRGFIAVLFAIVLAGGLTWALIYKKRKEGSR